MNYFYEEQVHRMEYLGMEHVNFNDLVSRGELNTDTIAMACGKSRDDARPLKCTNVDGSFAECALAPAIDVLGVRVPQDGNSRVAFFYRLSKATRLLHAKLFL